ncbi:MAG: DUF4097 domain-containing protein [Endomicrobium sp.]|jgi:hypothetical protein|nr:DUF4097 domain-containing protein [Endomicrobium sp.]
MKKFFVPILLLVFSCYLFAESYLFPAKDIKEINIVINNGTLNIKSTNAKDIVIDISPNKSPNTDRQISVKDKELNVYLIDSEITDKTIINMSVPKQSNLEINSIVANINIYDVSGTLDLDATTGNINITNFNGQLEIDSIDTTVKASGIFKYIDIENTRANITVTLNKLPSNYNYSIKGGGNILFNAAKGINKANISIDSHEFDGTFTLK